MSGQVILTKRWAFSKSFCWKTSPSYKLLGFDWSNGMSFIKSEIPSTTRKGQLLSSNKWKVPEDKKIIFFVILLTGDPAWRRFSFKADIQDWSVGHIKVASFVKGEPSSHYWCSTLLLYLYNLLSGTQFWMLLLKKHPLKYFTFLLTWHPSWPPYKCCIMRKHRNSSVLFHYHKTLFCTL